MFLTAKERLLDVNDWNSLFQANDYKISLTDKEGKRINRDAHVHDVVFIAPVNENQTEVQLLFDGNFNPFIKMMVEKPLQNFLNALTDKLEQL